MRTCKSIAQRRLVCLAHATGEVHNQALPAAAWVHHMPSCMRSYCIMSCYNKPSVKFTSYVYIISFRSSFLQPLQKAPGVCCLPLRYICTTHNTIYIYIYMYM